MVDISLPQNGASESRLPATPSLELLGDFAKALRKALRASDPEAISRLLKHHPKYESASAGAVAGSDVSLRDAQLVIAREHGYENWASLKKYVVAANEGARAEAIISTTAVEAIAKGDCPRLLALLQADPSIVNVGGALDFRYSKGAYFAGATLLHYVSGTPTEENTLPDNVLEIIEILLDAGADVNATTQTGLTTLSLIAAGPVP